MARVVRVPRSATARLGDAVAEFLADRDLAPTTRRVYGVALAALVADLGGATALGDVERAQLAAHLRARYPAAAPRTWNRVVATLGSFFAWAERQGLVGVSPAVGLERKRERTTKAAAERARAIGAGELVAFLDRPHPLREKTLWWLLYETAARAEEALGLDVADLDTPNRRAVVVAKGANAEEVAWDTRTARLLPRLLAGRQEGPVFCSSLLPSARRLPARADLDPTSGRSRLSYRRAAECFEVASGGWTLHQLRHSRLSHLAEAGLSTPLLMAKSRHTSARTLAVYARPTFDAMVAATEPLDPARRRRGPTRPGRW